MKWELIETAPHKTYVLVYDERTERYSIGKYDWTRGEDDGEWHIFKTPEGEQQVIKPSHWQPVGGFAIPYPKVAGGRLAKD